MTETLDCGDILYCLTHRKPEFQSSKGFNSSWKPCLALSLLVTRKHCLWMNVNRDKRCWRSPNWYFRNVLSWVERPLFIKVRWHPLTRGHVSSLTLTGLLVMSRCHEGDAVPLQRPWPLVTAWCRSESFRNMGGASKVSQWPSKEAACWTKPP